MNPITIRIYDVNCNQIVTKLLDMCISSSSTTEGIYSVLDGRLVDLLKSPNPWDMCTSVGVDNTSVNIAVRDSLKTRVLKRNLAISFNGCACHILHNAAQRAAGFTGAC